MTVAEVPIEGWTSPESSVDALGVSGGWPEVNSTSRWAPVRTSPVRSTTRRTPDKAMLWR